MERNISEDPLQNTKVTESPDPLQKETKRNSTHEHPAIPSSPSHKISVDTLQQILKFSSLTDEISAKLDLNAYESFWSDLFEKTFRNNKDWIALTEDDLLYYVKKGKSFRQIDLSMVF